ncbi:hypothetical protein J1N35_013415 [Gossypium stocksii]|uniref:Uncharacterized protein n=1 Tax=Gossypium stocksii TaxID=47602 RepID=A0A9D3VUV9_9ROSI|nr:hypothetical protein J1N35_013415 [Gossypium stocksii]
MRRVYYHSARRAFAIGIAGGWVLVTRSASSTDWGVVSYELLGAISNNINGGQIQMGWLQDTFPEPGDAIEQSQNRRLPITTVIMGTVSLSIITSSSGPTIYISTNNEVEPFGELCRNTYLSRRYTTSIRPTIRFTSPIGELCYGGDAPIR